MEQLRQSRPDVVRSLAKASQERVQTPPRPTPARIGSVPEGNVTAVATSWTVPLAAVVGELSVVERVPSAPSDWSETLAPPPLVTTATAAAQQSPPPSSPTSSSPGSTPDVYGYTLVTSDPYLKPNPSPNPPTPDP